MEHNFLIKSYDPSHFRFKHIHSVGPAMFFHRPCIAYIKKGYAEFLHKGKTIYAREGDLIYIAFETTYQSIWFGSPDIEWYSISFEFNSKFSFYDYRFQIFKNYPGELFEKIYSTNEISPLLSISYFYQLLDDVYSKLKNTPNKASSASIETALDYIDTNYNKKISVKTLADLCYCSESEFFRLFKKATGVTPIAYKHNIMIQNAIELLSNTSKSIDEISSDVGFSSPNYFRTIFSKATGKTPKELRTKR